MKTLVTLSFIAVAAMSLAEQCKDIPAFQAVATNGKTYTAASLSAKPTIVVFLSMGCPHNPHSVPDLNRLAKQVGPKVQFVGVVNAPASEAAAYAKELKLAFPLLADVDRKIIRGFGAQHSLDLALICAKDKKIAEVTEGYSRSIVKGIFDSLPSHGGPTLKPDLSGYPAKRRSGCGL